MAYYTLWNTAKKWIPILNDCDYKCLLHLGKHCNSYNWIILSLILTNWDINSIYDEILWKSNIFDIDTFLKQLLILCW